MPVSDDMHSKLLRAVRDAKIRVVGQDLVKNDSEAILLTAMIRAYGDSDAGFIYARPSRAKSTVRPPDVVLCHPEVGLLVVEAKGFPIDDVNGLEAGSIFVRYQGHTRPENVIAQVEHQMFEIDRDIRRALSDRKGRPLTNSMVAFPNIRESEWVSRGYDRAHPSSQFLFMDQLEDLGRLRKRVGRLVADTMAKSHRDRALDPDQLNAILQVFGNSDVINEKRLPRARVEKNRLGNYIDEMMSLDKYLSEEQKELSRLPVEASPRLVRGVAGSGKSVVLANMVARYLHRKLGSLQGSFFPEDEVSIGVVCFNNALAEFLKRKVRAAFREQTLSEDIPSRVLSVVHLNGLMYALIRERGWPLEYIRVSDVSDGSVRARLYIEQIAQFAEASPDYYRSLCFDALFVDEGQDFDPDEYRLLLQLVKPHPGTDEKPIVIFYDDAQNLYGRPRPVWRDLGINVAVGDRSRVMQECFRNTRPIVELAFNVLLGSQAPPYLRVQTRTYADVAYLKERGLLEEVGDHFRVGFTQREGPVPEVKCFQDPAKELDWVGTQIAHLVHDEQVRHEDILVLFDSEHHFDVTGLKEMLEILLDSCTFVQPYGQTDAARHYIFQPGCLTMSTVHGAKGYDAPIVFLVGADRFDTGRAGRAAFFVGATRAKMRLYVTGTEGGGTLLQEAIGVCRVI